MLNVHSDHCCVDRYISSLSQFLPRALCLLAFWNHSGLPEICRFAVAESRNGFSGVVSSLTGRLLPQPVVPFPSAGPSRVADVPLGV